MEESYQALSKLCITTEYITVKVVLLEINSHIFITYNFNFFELFYANVVEYTFIGETRDCDLLYFRHFMYH